MNAAQKAWQTRWAKKNKKYVDYPPTQEELKKVKVNKNRKRALKAWETIRKRGYKGKKQKRSLYNNRIKDNQRKILVELIKEKKELFEKSNPLKQSRYMPKIIYLDSPNLYFTKTLDKESINNEFNLVIPNDEQWNKFHWGDDGGNIFGQRYVQYKEHIHGDLYKPIRNVILERQSFKEYITEVNNRINVTDNYFNTFFIWADYCGSFSSYLADIELVFKNKILGNNSIYAMTFCRRDVARNKKIPKYSNTNCIVAVNDYVLKIAKKYGYKVELHEKSGFYKASMFTAIFIVEHKYISKNQEQIEKALETYNNLILDLKHKMSSQFSEIEDKIINQGIE